jgi:hypothetical protein
MRIFIIFDPVGVPVITSKSWCYKTLGGAKTAAKNYFNWKNKSLKKTERIPYDKYSIREYDLSEFIEHKI